MRPSVQQDAQEAASAAPGRSKGRPRQEGKTAPPPKPAPAPKPEPVLESAPTKSAPTKSAPKPAPKSVLDEEDEEGESQTLFLDKLPEAPAYSDFPLATTRSASRKSGQAGQRERGRHVSAKPREHLVEKQAKSWDNADQGEFSNKDLDEGGTDGLPERPFEELDLERLKSLTMETVQRLVSSVVGDARYELHLADSRVYVSVDCGENSGVLIGREGQTLAALQYLASRIVSRGMNAAVRVNLDAGDYKQRQDDKLQELALHLAAKVKNTGRACSTRPLNSYHRRIIHLALQEDEQVQTRSTGDGVLKRVVVQRRR